MDTKIAPLSLNSSYPAAAGERVVPSVVGGVAGVRAVVRRGWTMGMKVAFAGAAIASVPVVLPPLILLSTIGIVMSVPFGVYFASFACTEKLMRSLLPISNKGDTFEATEGERDERDAKCRVCVDDGRQIIGSSERRELDVICYRIEGEGVEVMSDELVEDMETKNERNLGFQFDCENDDARIVDSTERQELDANLIRNDSDVMDENMTAKNEEILEFQFDNVNGSRTTKRNESEQPDSVVLVAQSEYNDIAKNGNDIVWKAGDVEQDDFEKLSVSLLARQREVEDVEQKLNEGVHGVACENERPILHHADMEVEIETKVPSFTAEDSCVECGERVYVEQMEEEQLSRELVFENPCEAKNEVKEEQVVSADAFPGSRQSLSGVEASSSVNKVETENDRLNAGEPLVIEHAVNVVTWEVIGGSVEQEIVEKNLQIGGEKSSDHFCASNFDSKEEKNSTTVLFNVKSSGYDDDSEQASLKSSDYVSAVEYQSSDITDIENVEEHFFDVKPASSKAGAEREFAGPSHAKDLYSFEKLWKQIYALRVVIGYKAALRVSLVEECEALFNFVGVEAPVPFTASLNLKDLNDRLQLLKSVVGVQ